MDANMLYSIMAVLVAIVFGLLIFKSDKFKAKVTKEGVDIDGGKFGKTITTIENITNQAKVDIEQHIAENHHTETTVRDVHNATVTNKLKK
jgi:hypothetical protein